MTSSKTELADYPKIWTETLGWRPSADQKAMFQQLYSQILVGNQQLNLTRLTQPDEFWEKHLWDSLSGISPWLEADDDSAAKSDTNGLEEGAKEVGYSATAQIAVPISEVSPADASNAHGRAAPEKTKPIAIVDVGTGGGFPGIPAAIALNPSQVQLTLVDSTRKKIIFLQTLCHALGLTAQCLAVRAESLGQDPQHRSRYDLGLVRAVGPAATCAEYIIPLLKVGGQAVLYRGQWQPSETEMLIPVLDLLGAELTDIQAWQTPLTQSQRHCLFLHKAKDTPSDFPRAVGVPGKTPLA